MRESLKRLTYLSGCNWKYMPKLYMACLKSYYTGIVSSHSSCHSLEIVFYSSSGKYTRKENREKNSNKSCNKAPPPPPDSHTATYTHVTFQCNFFCIRLFSWSIKSNYISISVYFENIFVIQTHSIVWFQNNVYSLSDSIHQDYFFCESVK